MIDSFTKKPIRVYDDGGGEPYIIVRLDQLDAVKKLLDRAGCRYHVDDDQVSINGHPFVTIVSLEPGVDVAAIQKKLDDNEAPKMTRRRRSQIGHRG
jgi:hypothetical protein